MKTLVTAKAVRTGQGVVGDCLLIYWGKVVAVGWASELGHLAHRHERYPGAVIVPGLGDAHFHPFGFTGTLTGLTLRGCRSLSDIVEAVVEQAARQPPTAPVVGNRLDEQFLAEGRLPTRTELDAVSAPVLLFRVCGHVASANTAALELAGIDPDTPDPNGGSFDRDASGAPTGILREKAITLVSRVLATGSIGPEQLVAKMMGLSGLGMTRLGAMVSAGKGLWAGSGDELGDLLSVAPDLPVPMSVLIDTEKPDVLEQAAQRLSQSTSAKLSFLGVKLFADGALGGHTAAMREPFADQETLGTLRLSVADMLPVAERSLALGGMVAVHAIGDAANHEVMDLMETLINKGANPKDLRVEHASVLTQSDVERMAELGILATVQPAFVASELDWLEDRLGPERIEMTYAIKSLSDAGVRLSGSSDCPVEPPSPLWGMRWARDRSGLGTAQEVDGATALGLFTDGVHDALRLPIPFSEGAPASFTILGDDPVTCDATAVSDLEVVATWIDGVAMDVSQPTQWPV
jgi:predicted amidohydrolase YtcJ